MPRKSKALALDAWSVFAYFEGEAAGERVADLIADAHENKVELLMTTVNAGEVWYIIARATSAAEADASIAELGQLGIRILDVDWRLAREAAGIKTRHHLSFADCFAAALAKQHKADLVTGDADFRRVESEIRVTWLSTPQS